MPEVRLINVTKKYGEIVANDDVNLTIEDGEYVSIIGPSGCGKSTLIKNIAGIIGPDEGEIYIGGERVNDLPIEDRRIGYVFQNMALFPHMNLWDNITYGLRVKGLSQEAIRPLAVEMLEMIKLSARSEEYPSNLSSGSKQKTAVARALISKPTLLLLDEPLGALDIKVRAELRNELRRLVKEMSLTALHITHDQEEAMAISDRVIVMKKGRVVEVGSPIDLFTRPRNIFTANFVGEANFIQGRVTSVSDLSSIDIGGDLLLLVESRSQNVGDLVVTAFRPEFVVLGKRRSHNNLSGEIVEGVYSGSLGRFRVKLANGKLVVIKMALNNRQLFNIGDKITFNIPPKNIFVYPYPEGGLTKELALE